MKTKNVHWHMSSCTFATTAFCWTNRPEQIYATTDSIGALSKNLGRRRFATTTFCWTNNPTRSKHAPKRSPSMSKKPRQRRCLHSHRSAHAMPGNDTDYRFARCWTSFGKITCSWRRPFEGCIVDCEEYADVATASRIRLGRIRPNAGSCSWKRSEMRKRFHVRDVHASVAAPDSVQRPGLWVCEIDR